MIFKLLISLIFFILRSILTIKKFNRMTKYDLFWWQNCGTLIWWKKFTKFVKLNSNFFKFFTSGNHFLHENEVTYQFGKLYICIFQETKGFLNNTYLYYRIIKNVSVIFFSSDLIYTGTYFWHDREGKTTGQKSNKPSI